jgi:hypothetical protein
MSTRLLSFVIAAALCPLAASAQQTRDPSSVPVDPSSAKSATYGTPDGPLTVTTGQPAPRSYAAPPPFSALAHGNNCITSADANGYDLLANDFIHADANRDGCVSEHEYQSWVRTPR